VRRSKGGWWFDTSVIIGERNKRFFQGYISGNIKVRLGYIVGILFEGILKLISYMG